MGDATNKDQSVVIVVEGSEEKDIPSPFPFPTHFTNDIELGLTLKKLHPNQQSKLCTRIAHVMLLYKQYPTKVEFENVARELIAKYPFLKSPVDPYVSQRLTTIVKSTSLTSYSCLIGSYCENSPRQI